MDEVNNSIGSHGYFWIFTVIAGQFFFRSAGQAERLPDCKEADKLARAILLCVDMEKDQPGTEISETLESLLAPLLDTLSRVSTNIYLPVRKSDKSLQLMLRLFQLGGGTPCAPCDGEVKGLY